MLYQTKGFFYERAALILDTSEHTFRSLFMQLGLDSSNQAIAEFIHTHRLNGNESLDQAGFWTPGQASFIRECWLTDSDWVGTIEQLNEALHD